MKSDFVRRVMLLEEPKMLIKQRPSRVEIVEFKTIFHTNIHTHTHISSYVIPKNRLNAFAFVSLNKVSGVMKKNECELFKSKTSNRIVEIKQMSAHFFHRILCLLFLLFLSLCVCVSISLNIFSCLISS